MYIFWNMYMCCMGVNVLAEYVYVYSASTFTPTERGARDTQIEMVCFTLTWPTQVFKRAPYKKSIANHDYNNNTQLNLMEGMSAVLIFDSM